MLQPGHARERGLDGKGHEAFHVLHRKRRLDDIDLHLIVGDIRHCIDGQPRKRHRTHQGEHQRDHHHEIAVGNGEMENTLEHLMRMVVASPGLAELGL